MSRGKVFLNHRVFKKFTNGYKGMCMTRGKFSQAMDKVDT